jgi:ribonuclease VapC
MFLDASAIIAILTGEPEATAFAGRVESATRPVTSPIAIYETVLGLARIGNIPPSDAQSLVDQFLAESGIAIVPITDDIGRGAVQAFDRFGKGRHPASLNMGDCFAYACARALRTVLLFKGADFSRTDIATIGQPYP